MFRREKLYCIALSRAEKKLVRFCLVELRNKLIAENLETDEIDALLTRFLE